MFTCCAFVYISRGDSTTVIWFDYKQTQVILVHYVCNLAFSKTMCGSGMTQLLIYFLSLYKTRQCLSTHVFSLHILQCRTLLFIQHLFTTSSTIMYIKGQPMFYVKPPTSVSWKFVPIKAMIVIWVVHIIPQISQ